MEAQLINHRNVQKYCRTCLMAVQKDSAVESQKYNIQKTPDLSKWINIYTSLGFPTNENYPKYICQECYETLKSFHNFSEMCIQSKRTLDRILESCDCDEPDTQIVMSTTKRELCYEDVNPKSCETTDYKSELNSCEKPIWHLHCEKDDKSLITPIGISNYELNELKNDWNANITESCKEILENKKPFEYKDCSEIAVHEHTKLLDTVDYLEVGIKTNLSENETKDFQDLTNAQMDRKTINRAEENTPRKCKPKSKNKNTTSSKNSKKQSVSAVKDLPNMTLEKDFKVSKGKFSCTLCKLKFYKQDSLDGHIRRDHQGLKPFQCDKCECGYNKAYRLKLHMNRAHGNKVNEEVMCHVDGCGKKFRNNASYKTHYHNKHTEHANLLRTFICEDCGSSFKNMISLKKHRYKHGPPEDYPFHCDQCDKRFSTKYKYKQHQDRHAGIKNFECPYCGLKKTTNDELRTHINYHTKERQWPCPDCTSVFNSSGSLGQHFRIVHQRIRRYACRYCGDSFAKPETLKHHEMRHTGEKPHECQICGKRFIQQVALRTHLKTHEKNEQKLNTNIVKTVMEIEKSKN